MDNIEVTFFDLSVSIIKEVLEKYDIERDETIINSIAEKRIKRFEKCLRQVDKNIIDNLEYLSRRGRRMCLISNADVIDKIGLPENEIKLSKYCEKLYAK